MNILFKSKFREIIKDTFKLLIFIVILLIIAPFIIFWLMGFNSKVTYKEVYSAQDFGLKSNDFYLLTEDNYNVWVSEVRVDKPKGVVIYLSGIQYPSVTAYYGHSEWMAENGYATILLEIRGHGKSDGDRICFGYNENRDVDAVVKYINNEEYYKDIPIILQGVSMGGAVAVNSFGLNKEIDALICMSTYSSFEDAACEMYNVPKLAEKVIKLFVKLYMYVFFGEDSIKNVPIKLINEIGDRKALIVHSKYDTNVPVDNYYRLIKKSPIQSKFILRDSYEHFIIKNNDICNPKSDEEYCNMILDFLNGL